MQVPAPYPTQNHRARQCQPRTREFHWATPASISCLCGPCRFWTPALLRTTEQGSVNPEPGSSTGPHLLASVASAAHAGSGPLPYSEPQSKAVPGPAVASRGPYNPAAVLPTKVAKRILDRDFVEMSEIALDDPPVQVPGQPPLPARPPVQDISVWVEKYLVMAALLASRFPEKAPELFAYQASIVRAGRNFVDRRWVAYDRCFRREALAQKNLDWSEPNARLYNEAFTGRAKVLPRCSFCLQEDHVAQYCPRNPNRPWPGWYQDTTISQPLSRQQPTPRPPPQSPAFCRRYNEGKCKHTVATCHYTHRCMDCSGPHPRQHCPRGGQRAYARPRSPGNSPRQMGPPAIQHPGTRY